MRTPDMDYEPDDEEQAVLDVLREHGRANPMLIREETDLRKEYVSRALTGLQKAGVVRKVVRGLYEHVPENDDEHTEIHEHGAGDVPGEPGGYTGADLSIDDDQDIDVQVGATPEEAEDLRARLDHVASLHDEQVDATEALEEELEDCRERLEQAEGNTAEVPIGDILASVSAALTALSGQSPDVDMARSELERVQEVLQEHD